ncbi:MAG: hypothetical protein WCI29_13855 [Actinomycetes bacterium]
MAVSHVSAAHGADQGDHVVADGVGACSWSSGAGSECVPAAVAPCGYELADAGLGDAVEAGHFGLGLAGEDGFDDYPVIGHVMKAD